MITPKHIVELDQATKVMIDQFPPFWWGLFKKSIDLGFTRDEALELVKTQIRIAGGTQ